MMLEFHCVLDVSKEIRAFVAELSEESQDFDNNELDLKIVGQEQDGCLLYTWAGRSPRPLQEENQDQEVAPTVTHIGLYDPINKTNKTLFVHERLVEVVNCSVSQERTFLGFVTLEQTYISEGYGRRQKQDKYQAYLAELASPAVPSRVFYLNLERQHYIRLQFLYGQYRGQVARREAHLLVVLHGESIGLYHIPMARVGSDGVILSAEPKKDQIFQKRFVWSQWDASHQRLYVAQHRRQSKSGQGSAHRCYMTCYQFTEATVNEFMLDVPLDLPVPNWKGSSQRSHYLSPGPHQSIPDSTINMCVLAQNSGTLCICFQHPVPSSKSSKSDTPSPTPSDTGGDTGPLLQATLQYSVVMVHHANTFTCAGIKMPRAVAKKSRILFTLVGDYLVAHLEGYFTHLLNVGVEFEPCHHILWHEPKTDANSTSMGDSPHTLPIHLMPLIWERHTSSASPGALVYDPQSQKGYKMTFDLGGLLNLFTSSTSPTTRLAILHYSVVHHRDLFFTKKLFRSILTDPADPQVVGLLEEFLVGSTYATLRRQMELYVMRYMPFTCSPTFRGQTETSSDGTPVSSITYNTVTPITFGNLSKVKSDHHIAEMWTHLLEVSNTAPTAARFTSQQVQQHLDTIDEDEAEFVKVPHNETPSLFQKLATVAKSALSSTKPVGDTLSGPRRTPSRAPSRSEILLGPPPSFLSDTTTPTDGHQRQLMGVTSELLTTHLKKFLKKDSRSKIRNIASEYVACQMQQSRHLAHILCSLHVPDELVSEMTLDTPANPEEHRLFLTLERYYMALDEQGLPYPPGFPLYFACLAFRSLSLRVFKQYMDNQVLRISEKFAEKMLNELPDSCPEVVSMKLAVLGQLAPAVGIALARQWSHPVSRRFLAVHYADSCLSEGEKIDYSPIYKDGGREDRTTTGDTRSASPTPKDVGFPPLDTLMATMEKKVSRQFERGKSNHQTLDRYLLQEAAFAEFYESGSQRGDIITFG